jgi:hypothetical protein
LYSHLAPQDATQYTPHYPHNLVYKPQKNKKTTNINFIRREKIHKPFLPQKTRTMQRSAIIVINNIGIHIQTEKKDQTGDLVQLGRNMHQGKAVLPCGYPEIRFIVLQAFYQFLRNIWEIYEVALGTGDVQRSVAFVFHLVY